MTKPVITRLHRHFAEFDYRYNARKQREGERTVRAIPQAVGERLRYQQTQMAWARAVHVNAGDVRAYTMWTYPYLTTEWSHDSMRDTMAGVLKRKVEGACN